MDCALITEASLSPSCSRARRLDVEVFALKNVAQFFSIAAMAPLPLVGSPPLAGAELGAADEVAGVAGCGVAASAAAAAAARAERERRR